MMGFAETHFVTKQDAIDYDIEPALGDYADDFDLDGIFSDAYEYQDGYFVRKANVDFYDVAVKYDITANHEGNMA